MLLKIQYKKDRGTYAGVTSELVLSLLTSPSFSLCNLFFFLFTHSVNLSIIWWRISLLKWRE